MLSTSLHGYPTDFGASNMVTQNQIPQQQQMTTGGSGLDALAETSQYHLQQLRQQQAINELHANGSHIRHRDSYSNSVSDGMNAARRESASMVGKVGRSSNGQPVRRRISRACDQCNQLRTKCDGQQPCAHCVEFGLTCEYARERKKRGKASRKDIAAQQAAAQATVEGKDQSPRSGNENESDETTSNDAKPESERGIKRRRSSSNNLPPPQLAPSQGGSMSARPTQNGNMGPPTPFGQGAHLAEQQRMMSMDQPTPGMGLPTPRLPNAGMPERGMQVAMGDYGSMDDYHRSVLHPGATMTGHNILHSGVTGMPSSVIQGGTVTGYGETPFAVPSPGSQQGIPGQAHFKVGESPLSAGFFGQSPMAGSPGWLSLPSPSGALYPHLQHGVTNQVLRYPVLRPLLPHISAIIPIGLACDLLELYFTSTSSAFLQPQSPYVLAYLFRKRSFLRKHNQRPCSPALLASMLWVGAQTSESAFLTSPPSARGKICQKLLELTVGLLKPLIHTSADAAQNAVVNGVALGGFGVGMPGQPHEMEAGSPGATGALDDVATYIQLATVVSASEYKAASLRWWNAAWSLARELKLGRELPPNTEQQGTPGQDGEAPTAGNTMPLGQPPGTAPAGIVSEEEREERRRIWWLLYIVDRHLALCYNRPLFLLDVECDGLLQPESDAVFQAGDFYPPENYAETSYFKPRGPTFECTGHNIFGYFLPLMAILGEVVDLNHARNHPRFGTRFRNASEWDGQVAEIAQQLETYERSLKEFEARYTTPQQPAEPKQQNDAAAGHEAGHQDATSPSAQSVGTQNSGQRITETMIQTKIVVAYATHLMHTLHILLNGKWDPISLLDDNDLWISSQSFISATGHAVSAAEAINDILDYDPDISFMPFFFGIYLLQGSFLLLLIADKLQGEASPSVVKACETIVRAHEACVVTLNTEYQRNFRKVMRSALAQVRGRLPEDFGEQQQRRREVLALYRWTGDGTGLAL
ncbi:Xylanolytic transcriptional activator [Hortaea werneckii]|nr:Xylanolytic transcriptional activator [Hortaea werneckii]